MASNLARSERGASGRRAATVVLALCLAGCIWAGGPLSCLGPSPKDQALKDAELYYRLGDGAFRDRNIPAAIKDLLKAVQANPDHANAHHLLGFIYMGRQEYDQALTHFKRAVELAPELLEAQNNLGTCYLALCRWQEAEVIFAKLVVDPLYQTPYIAYNNLGMALLHQGRREEAVIRFQRAIFLDPTFCVAFNNLGMTLLDLGQLDDAQRALIQANSADASCANYAEPYFHMGRLLERVGRPEQALQQYQRCHELTRTNIPLGHGCGSVPIGPRCEQKLRQRGQLDPWSAGPGDSRR